jgi:hypothetical protein
MPRTHPPYAPEYRRRIIELARMGRPIAQLAREFEASANVWTAGIAVAAVNPSWVRNCRAPGARTVVVTHWRRLTPQRPAAWVWPVPPILVVVALSTNIASW